VQEERAAAALAQEVSSLGAQAVATEGIVMEQARRAATAEAQVSHVVARGEELLRQANVAVSRLQARVNELEVAMSRAGAEVSALASQVAERDRMIAELSSRIAESDKGTAEAMASYRAVAMQLEEQKRIAQEWNVKAHDWLNRSTLAGAHAARQAQGKLTPSSMMLAPERMWQKRW